MTTMADVARHAGVSASTVSYAISGKRPIAQETRDRIEQAIAELGFAPNAGARALASSQTHVLGLFVQFLPDEFSPAMLQYVLPISDAARAAGYDCDYQGISSGWGDWYYKQLGGQWIDITGVPEGDYIVQVAINATGAFDEGEDRYPNVVEVAIHVPDPRNKVDFEE